MANGKFGLPQVRAALKAEERAWEAGKTSVSELPPDEQRLRLGYTPGPDHPSLEEREAAGRERAAAAAAAPAVGYPATHDWRDAAGRNFITPIRDQGGCGSCVAFGTVATIEGTARVRRDNPSFGIDLSEAHLFYCLGGAEGRNCGNGWWPDPALNACRDTGVVDDACFPYTGHDQPCNLCTNWQSRVTKVTGWHSATDHNDMRVWLSTRGPLVTCFTVYQDFYYYASGVYRHVSGNAVGGHCVSVVGYNDIDQYWICKNSWGTGFGESGFFRIAYGECGIDGTMWMVEDVVSPATTTSALYRYWNPDIGDHFYTTNWNELGAGKYGWHFEEIQCYVYAQQQPGTVPLYRYWNSSIGDHFYTTDWGELGGGNYGWAFEGVQCYVCPVPAANSQPLYRYWNSSAGDHFYTTSWEEIGRGAYGWNFEGIQCYVLIPEVAVAAEAGVPSTFSTSKLTQRGGSSSFVLATGERGGAPESFRTSSEPA